MDNATEQLAAGVWRISAGPLLNAFLIAGDGRGDAAGLTLVDCGTRKAGPRLVRSIRMLGFDPTAVNSVVLTHWHADHMGSAARFAASSAQPTIRAGVEDLPAIQGDDRHPHRGVAPADISLSGRFVSRIARPGPAVTAIAAHDGTELPHANGAVVVATPGHTRGHISILVPRSGVLIAGDAVMNLGRLVLGPPPFRSARSFEAATLRRMAALEFDVLAVGHGAPVLRGAQAKLRRLAQKAEG